MIHAVLLNLFLPVVWLIALHQLCKHLVHHLQPRSRRRSVIRFSVLPVLWPPATKLLVHHA